MKFGDYYVEDQGEKGILIYLYGQPHYRAHRDTTLYYIFRAILESEK